MDHRSVSLAAAAAWLLVAATGAEAQCDFNVAPAKGMSANFVRAWSPCPSTDNPASNTGTEGGMQACTPVIPYGIQGDETPYKFGPKGACSIRSTARMIDDCSTVLDSAGNPLNLESGACHITFLKGKCSGLVHNDGNTPVDGVLFPEDDGWTLSTLTRATLKDDVNGAMTVIDFPVVFDFTTPSKGKMTVAGSSAEALKPIVGVTNADLPPCTSIELVRVTIKDPDGRPFAVPGGSTSPD